MFVLPLAVILGIGYYFRQLEPRPTAAQHTEAAKALRGRTRPAPSRPPLRHEPPPAESVPMYAKMQPAEIVSKLEPYYSGLQPKGMNAEKFMDLGRVDFTAPPRDVINSTVHDTRPFQIDPNMLGQNVSRERTQASDQRANVLPFEQIRMGPGLGLGTKPVPDDPVAQDMFKREVAERSVVTTDQLRTADNPKDGVIGRMTGVPALGEKRPIMGTQTHKQRKKEHKTGPASWIRTTGAYLKGMLRPKKVLGKPQYRGTQQTGLAAFQGPGATFMHKPPLEGQVSPALRQMSHALGYGNMMRGGARMPWSPGVHDDCGRRAIMLRPTGRSSRRYARVHFGNAQTAVSALAEPFRRRIRMMRRQQGSTNPRMMANLTGKHQAMPVQGDATRPVTHRTTTMTAMPLMNLSGPQKSVVYDPDTAQTRTTIRETTHASTPAGAMTGPTKGVVYDPDAVKRTTHRATTLTATPAANLSGPQKMAVQDGVARTTMKETTLANTPAGAFVGPTKGLVYDPDAVARTTLKETLLTDMRARHGGQIDSGWRATGTALHDTHDLNQIRATLRQTLSAITDRKNLQGDHQALPVWDPDAAAPDPTMRELIGPVSYYPGGAESAHKAQPARLSDDELVAQLRETLRGLDEMAHYYGPANVPNALGGYVTYPEEQLRETLRGLQELLDLRGVAAQDVFASPLEAPNRTVEERGTCMDEAIERATRHPWITSGPKQDAPDPQDLHLNPHKAMARDAEQKQVSIQNLLRAIDACSRQNMVTDERPAPGLTTRKDKKGWQAVSAPPVIKDPLEVERKAMAKAVQSNPFIPESGLDPFQ